MSDFKLSKISVSYTVPLGFTETVSEAFNRVLSKLGLEEKKDTATDVSGRSLRANCKPSERRLDLSDLAENVWVTCRIITGLDPADNWKPIMLKFQREVKNSIRMSELVSMIMKAPELNIPKGVYNVRVFRVNGFENSDPPIEIYWKNDANRRIHRVFKETKSYKPHRLIIDLTQGSVLAANSTRDFWQVAVHPNGPYMDDSTETKSSDRSRTPTIKKSNRSSTRTPT